MMRRRKNNKTRKTIDLSQLIRDQLTVFNIVGDPTDLSSATPRTRKYGSKGRLYDAMELDYTIDSALASLFGAVKSFEPVVEGSDEVIEFVQNEYLGHPQYWNYVDHILSAISRGLAVVQPIIEYRDGKNVIQKFVLPSIDWFRYNKDGRLLFKRKFGSYEDVTDYVYDFRFRATDEYPYGRGILQGCFVPWSLKKLMMEEWAEANLNWSSPVTVFKRPHRTFESSVESGDIAEIENIKDVGVLELYGEDDIEVLDFLKTGFHTSFKQMIQELDDGIRLIINKELLTTTEGRRVGSMALGLIHQDTKYQQVKMCTRFRELSEWQVLDDLIRMNFGDVEYSYHIDITPAKNLETTLTKKKIWEGIELSDGTKPVWDVEWLADETDVKLAKDKGVVISSGRMQLSKKPITTMAKTSISAKEVLSEAVLHRVQSALNGIADKISLVKKYEDFERLNWDEITKPLAKEIRMARLNGYYRGVETARRRTAELKTEQMAKLKYYDDDGLILQMKELGYTDSQITELLDTQEQIADYWAGETGNKVKNLLGMAVAGAVMGGVAFSDFKKDLLRLYIDWGLLPKDFKITPFSKYANDIGRTHISIAYSGGLWDDWDRRIANGEVIYLERWNPMDERTRPDHAKLVGLVLPATDPFWKLHPAPMDFGCRCEDRETTKEPTGIMGYEMPAVSEQWIEYFGGRKPNEIFWEIERR